VIDRYIKVFLDHLSGSVMKSSTSLLLLIFVLFSLPTHAQRSQRNQQFDPSEINKMPVVLIDMIERSYPKAHLQKVSNSSLMIIKKTIHDRTLKPMYFSTEVSLDEIESITLISKKRKWRTNLIGAAIGGTVGYFVGNQFRPDRLRQANIELISQPPQNGFIEPILGGIVGLGIGTIIGDLFTPLHIEGVSQNQKNAIAKLREYAPSRRSKKNKKKR
jgi:hypothetical protein